MEFMGLKDSRTSLWVLVHGVGIIGGWNNWPRNWGKRKFRDIAREINRGVLYYSYEQLPGLKDEQVKARYKMNEPKSMSKD